MKIVSWNCNGKFREKFKVISQLNADIYVIQECENPLLTKSVEYQQFAMNHLWIGNNKNKGLGIFAKRDIRIDMLDWCGYGLEYYLPVCVNDEFDLIGVWTHNCNYIEGCNVYTRMHLDKFSDSTIMLGDFNSNVIWNHEHGILNYSKNLFIITQHLRIKVRRV